MLALVGLAAVLVAIGGSLWLVMGRIHRRARRVGVSPVGALFLAYVGYLIGAVTAVATGLGLLAAVFGGLPGTLIFVTLIFSSVVGTVVGSGFGYVVLWARTTHDPDYEPLARGPAGDDPTVRRGR